MPEQPHAEELSLGRFMKQVLNERSMSANMLAMASGVAESTVRSLLKQGEDESAPGPHPLVLRAVCDVLELDHIRIFQMADYIPQDYYPTHLSPTAEYVGICFDALSADQQTMLLSMISSLDQTNAFLFNGARMSQLVQRVAELRQQHPMFRVRKFTAADEVGRVTGKALRVNPNEWFINSTFKRLTALFADEPDTQITRARIDAVCSHTNAQAILNMLLPRKEIPSALEKLYWLLRPKDFYRRDIEAMTEAEQDGCRALWRLLEETTQNA